MTDTPRTDAMQGHPRIAYVPVHFARELERELAAAKAEVGDLKTRLDTAWGDVGAMQGIVARVTAERDEARREVCNSGRKYWFTHGINGPKRFAEERGWDCFKEEDR